MRFKITDWIAISMRKVRQTCTLCGKPMSKVGVIIYYNHPTLRLYNWIHLNCIDRLKDGVYYRKTSYKYGISHDEIFRFNFIDFITNDDAADCSYCNEHNKGKRLLLVDNFVLHHDCIPPLISDIKSQYKLHEKEIITELL